MKNVIFLFILGMLFLVSCSSENDELLIENNNIEQAAYKPPVDDILPCYGCSPNPPINKAEIHLAINQAYTIRISGDKVMWYKYPYAGCTFIINGGTAYASFPREGTYYVSVASMHKTNTYIDSNGSCQQCYCPSAEYYYTFIVSGYSKEV